MSRVILIVEDDRFIAQQYARRMPGYRVVIAPNLSQARALFTAHREDLRGIIMDGALGGRELNTLGLIREIRAAGYTGMMIAASTSGSYMEQMVAAGCTMSLNKLALGRALPDVFG